MFQDSPVMYTKPMTLFGDDNEDVSLSEVLTPNAESKRAPATKLQKNNETNPFKIRKRLFKQCKSFDDSLLRGSPCFGGAREPVIPKKKIVHQHSLEDDRIMSTLEDMTINDNLLGDGTEVLNLPTTEGRHRDLKSISHQTMYNLMNGEYMDVIENYVIIDCRYPYEYDGGHIDGAKNFYNKDMMDTILENSSDYQQTVLIFHCEFSSERGPKMLRYLRKRDREINADKYPVLFFPEVYILDRGYKEFYTHHKECCEPQNYVPMLNKDYSEELRYFRIKSKSWNGEERRRCLRFEFADSPVQTTDKLETNFP